MLEDGLGGGGAKDDGDDAAPAPAAGAGEDVGLERPPEELGPGEGAAGPGLPWADGLGCYRAERCLCHRRRRGDDTGPHPGIGGEDTEVADEVGPWRRDERGHPAEEGHRGEDNVRLSGLNQHSHGQRPVRPATCSIKDLGVDLGRRRPATQRALGLPLRAANPCATY